MNKTGKCLLLVIVLSALMISILPKIALANSAEVPSLVILINNPPDDLSITLISEKNQIQARGRRVAWEGCYVFYSRNMPTSSMYTFRVTTNGESFECTLYTRMQAYNRVATLDISKQEIKSGKYPLRSVLLVSIRLLLTLLLEGIIFWLFGFRQKRSWLIFLATNLVTQGALNIWLNTRSGDSLLSIAIIFILIIGEAFVFATETIAFIIFIKEHKKSRIFIYVFIANFISFIAGGYIITVLPV